MLAQAVGRYPESRMTAGKDRHPIHQPKRPLMTPQQKHLARHALGLPSDRKRSYRNRYYATPKTPADAEWMEMVEAGYAKVLPASEPDETLNFFWLTRKGAEAALEPGETLDPEDFPAQAAA